MAKARLLFIAVITGIIAGDRVEGTKMVLMKGTF